MDNGGCSSAAKIKRAPRIDNCRIVRGTEEINLFLRIGALGKILYNIINANNIYLFLVNLKAEKFIVSATLLCNFVPQQLPYSLTDPLMLLIDAVVFNLSF